MVSERYQRSASAPCPTWVASDLARATRRVLAAALAALALGTVTPAVMAAPARKPAKVAPRAAANAPKAPARATPPPARTPPARTPTPAAPAAEAPVASPAAAPATAVVKTQEDRSGEKTYTFGAQEVEGRLKSPQILYFLRRVRAQFDPAPLGHRSFLLELSDTRRHPALR